MLCKWLMAKIYFYYCNIATLQYFILTYLMQYKENLLFQKCNITMQSYVGTTKSFDTTKTIITPNSRLAGTFYLVKRNFLSESIFSQLIFMEHPTSLCTFERLRARVSFRTRFSRSTSIFSSTTDVVVASSHYFLPRNKIAELEDQNQSWIKSVRTKNKTQEVFLKRLVCFEQNVKKEKNTIQKQCRSSEKGAASLFLKVFSSCNPPPLPSLNWSSKCIRTLTLKV